MSQALLARLKQKFAHAIISTHEKLGNETAVINKDDLYAVCEFLRDDAQCNMQMCIDVTAVDWLERQERFDVVYHFYSIEKKHRIRLKVPVGGEQPTVASITPLWKGANFFERETFDMYGIVFSGHPDLRRILLYPEFVGHPLRKDYPIAKTQPLIENRLRGLNYGITGISGDPTIVQIGGVHGPSRTGVHAVKTVEGKYNDEGGPKPRGPADLNDSERGRDHG